MDELLRLTRAVWRPRIVADDLIGRIAAVLSVLPPQTVVCGQTAAHLHGLWLPPDETRLEHIEVIVRPDIDLGRDRPHSVRSVLLVRRYRLAPDEITDLGGIPVTTEARTWLDLARTMQPADLVAAGDSALRGAATMAEIEELLGRASRRRGVIRARAAVGLLDGRSRSRPESHLRYVLVSNGLPRPQVNEPIFNRHGEWLAEPDLSYDDARLALEYNGAVHAQPERMRKDITRALDVSAADWRTEVFGPVQVFARPDQTAQLVRRLRVERCALLAAG